MELMKSSLVAFAEGKTCTFFFFLSMLVPDLGAPNFLPFFSKTNKTAQFDWMRSRLNKAY